MELRHAGSRSVSVTVAHGELVVPQPRSGPIVATVGTAIIVVFVSLALRNLLHGIAMIPSALWLLLIAFVVMNGIRESGWRGFWIAAAGAFSRQQVLAVSTSGDSSTLEVGFRLFGFNIVERRVPVQDLAGICWNTGQASELARRDADDWSVFLWYWHRDPAKEATQRKFRMRRPGQAPIVIGPPRAKSVTEALGWEVIGFLDDSGISVPDSQPGEP